MLIIASNESPLFIQGKLRFQILKHFGCCPANIFLDNRQLITNNILLDDRNSCKLVVSKLCLSHLIFYLFIKKNLKLLTHSSLMKGLTKITIQVALVGRLITKV